MREIWKWLWRVVLTASVLLAAASVSVLLLAPVLIERALEQELGARGFPDASFEVRHVGLRDALLGDLRIDEAGRLAVETLMVTYTPLGLLKGELRTLHIVGARWVVRVQGRSVDLGPVGALLREPGDPRGGGTLPLQRIVLRESEVVVETPEGTLGVPLQGELERTADGFRALASAELGSIPVELYAEVQQRPALKAEVLLTGRGEAEETIRLEDPRLFVRGLEVDLELRGALDQDTLEVFVESGSFVRAQKVGIGLEGALAIENPRLRIESPTDAPALQVELPEDGEPSAQASVRLVGGGGAITGMGLEGEVERVGAVIVAKRDAGQWGVQGRTELGLSSVVHEESGIRIEKVAATLPLHYPFAPEVPMEPGQVRVGPVHWRGAKLPALSAEVVQRGDVLDLGLRWPLTPSVAVQGSGHIGLTEPFDAEVRFSAPPLSLEETGAALAALEQAINGSLSGKATFAGRLARRDGALEHELRIGLDDVTLSRSSGLLEELRGITGTIQLSSIAPPLTPGGQRLTWKGGRMGKLPLGKGHVVVDLEEDRTIVVEELATEVGERGEQGRLLLAPFRYSPDDPKLHLDILAESLSLQGWLDLLGRDEVRATGTLDGLVSVTLQLEPSLRLELGEGELMAKPGGILELQDVQAAEAALGSALPLEQPTDLQRILKERLLEALQRLRYSTLRFEIIRRDDFVTLQVHLAGRGTRGARQEIGGLTININHFEEALNQLLRLRSGFERLESQEAREVSHVPSTPPL